MGIPWPHSRMAIHPKIPIVFYHFSVNQTGNDKGIIILPFWFQFFQEFACKRKSLLNGWPIWLLRPVEVNPLPYFSFSCSPDSCSPSVLLFSCSSRIEGRTMERRIRRSPSPSCLSLRRGSLFKTRAKEKVPGLLTSSSLLDLRHRRKRTQSIKVHNRLCIKEFALAVKYYATYS